jgi:hypothetical protein
VDRQLLVDEREHVVGHAVVGRQSDDCDRPTLPHQVRRGFDHGPDAGRVEELIGTLTVGSLQHDALDRLAADVDRNRPQLPRHVEPPWQEIAHDHLPGTPLARRDHGSQPDRARAEDDDGVAGPHAGQVAAVDPDGDRLAESAVVVAHVIGQRVSEIGPDHRVLGHRSLNRWSGVEGDVRAEVVAAGLAHRAATARDPGLDRHPGPHRQAPHGGPDGDDVAREFVANDHRALHHVPADAAVDVVVDVGGADPAGSNAHQDVLRADGRYRHLLYPQVMDAVQDRGFHGARQHVLSSACAPARVRRLGSSSPTAVRRPGPERARIAEARMTPPRRCRTGPGRRDSSRRSTRTAPCRSPR